TASLLARQSAATLRSSDLDVLWLVVGSARRQGAGEQCDRHEADQLARKCLLQHSLAPVGPLVRTEIAPAPARRISRIYSMQPSAAHHRIAEGVQAATVRTVRVRHNSSTTIPALSTFHAKPFRKATL